MSIEGQGHFFTIYFPGFVCFVLYLAKISGERLQDHWSSGSFFPVKCFIISAQHLLVLESSNFVYRIRTTKCFTENKPKVLRFILHFFFIFIFFYLSLQYI